MKYLKKFEGFEYHGPQYAKGICDEWGVDLEDIEDLFIDFADEGKVLIHPMVVNKEIQVTIHSIWKDLSDSDWLYNPIWDERFGSIKRRLRGMGLDMHVETKNLTQRFVSIRIGIWLGHLKTESLFEFQLDRITKQQYYSISDNNPLVYMPESKVVEFKGNLSTEYKLLYARGDEKGTVEWFRAEYETEINYHFTCKSFSIKKKSLGEDEWPCYIMHYNYEEFTSHAAPRSHIETLPKGERISIQRKFYFRFEESDFDQMCENPQILLDYLNNLDVS